MYVIFHFLNPFSFHTHQSKKSKKFNTENDILSYIDKYNNNKKNKTRIVNFDIK